MSTLSAHDALFRTAMANTQVAREFMQNNFPAHLVNRFDLHYLQLSPGTYVDDQLKNTQCDILYQTRLRDQAETVYLYLLVEHQSVADPLMPWRLLRYNVRIWEDVLKRTSAKKLPLIVNSVFYNGQQPYHYSTDFRDLLDAPRDLVDQVWAQPFHLIQAQAVADDALQQQKWAGALQFFMAHAAVRDGVALLKEAAPALRYLLSQESGDSYAASLLEYLLYVSNQLNIVDLTAVVKREITGPLGETIMTVAEQLKAEGFNAGMLHAKTLAEQLKTEGFNAGMEQARQQWMTLAEQLKAEGFNAGLSQARELAEQSKAEGIQQGEYLILLRQLEKKFSVIPAPYLQRIASANAEQLLQWSERLIDARNIEEIFTEN